MQLEKDSLNKKLFILGSLALLWVGLTFIAVVTSDFSPTVVSFNHERNNIHTESKISGRVWQGSFSAKEDYLGIVSVDFTNDQRPIKDIITFKIKEQGATDWMAVNTYDSRGFYTMEQFPLGFPVIEKSKGKKFEFQFIAMNQNLEDSFALVENEPIVVSKYSFPLNELVRNPLLLLSFLVKKVAFAFTLPSFFRNALVFSLPFFLYLFWIVFRLDSVFKWTYRRFHLTDYSKFTEYFQVLSKSPLGLVTFLLLVVNIFALKKSYTLFSLLIVVLWFFTIFRLKLPPKFSFIFAILLCLLLFPAKLFYFPIISEHLVVWIYYFLGIGSISALIKVYGNTK